MKIGKMKDPGGKAKNSGDDLPSFTYKVLAADAPTPQPDPETGAMIPGKTVMRTYRMEGNFMHRIVAPGAIPEGVAHPVAEEKKDKKGKKK